MRPVLLLIPLLVAGCTSSLKGERQVVRYFSFPAQPPTAADIDAHLAIETIEAPAYLDSGEMIVRLDGPDGLAHVHLSEVDLWALPPRLLAGDLATSYFSGRCSRLSRYPGGPAPDWVLRMRLRRCEAIEADGGLAAYLVIDAWVRRGIDGDERRLELPPIQTALQSSDPREQCKELVSALHQGLLQTYGRIADQLR